MGVSRFPRVALTAAALAVAVPLLGASLKHGGSLIPSKPYPERLVNDFAGAFTAAQADSLEKVLVAFDDSTSNQIAVVTVTTLGGMDVSEFALRLANEWGIGTSEKNNGLLILLKPRGSEKYVDVSVQVGRGLEGAIPDVYASRIIRNIMGPYLREDNYIKAVALGIDEFKALASGEISEPRDREAEDDDLLEALIFMLLWLGIVLLIVWLMRKGGGGGGRLWTEYVDESGNTYRRWGSGPIVIGGGGLGRGWGSGGFGGGFGGFGGGGFGGGGASGHF